MSTVSDLCQSALEDLGVLGAGETMASGDLATCFKSLNHLMDAWASERLTIYTITRTTWTIVSGTGTYTVGLLGDVVVARPDFITHVGYLDTSVTPNLELLLASYTDDAWARVSYKTLTSTLPTRWYYNPTYPLGTLDLWPVPTSATLSGVLYAPAATAQFAATSTSVALPPGYERFIIKSLALEIAGKFGAVPNPSIAQAARESKADIKRSNIRLSDLGFDPGALTHVGRASYAGFLSGEM